MIDSAKLRIIKYSSIIIVLILVFGATWVYVRLMREYGYYMRVEFDRLPENDLELEEWFHNKPGVVKVLIAREGEALKIACISKEEIKGYPTNPDLEKAWKTFGYENPHNIDWNYSDK